MARVKKGVNAHKRHKKILKQAKGFYGQRSKNFRAANPAVMRALRSAFVGRKNKKRERGSIEKGKKQSFGEFSCLITNLWWR